MMTKTDIERIVDERLAEMRKQMIEELQGQVESEDKSKTIWDLDIEDGESFYYLTLNGGVGEGIFNSNYDKEMRAVDNAFLTEEEAEFERERRKIDAVMRKYSSPFERSEHNYYIYYDYGRDKVVIDIYCLVTDGVPYFESEEIAQKVIDEIGEDRLKKYWFRVQNDE